MNAIVISQPGPADVLQLQERPTPLLQDHEVLVRVEAAGVNRPDIAQRKGQYPPPKWAPQDIPGLEVAGTIIETKGSRFRIGDRVCALVAGGGYAELCAVHEGHCLPIPKGLTAIEAASLPETFFTVWANVFDRARLQPGETFLVHGGTSGIGVAAIQMVKAFGGVVYATAGTDEKAKFCESIGARKGINYRTSDFVAVVRDDSQGRGVDVILDMIGGDYTPRNIEALAEDGRLAIINFQGGDETNIKLSKVLRKRLTITASTLRNRTDAFKADIAAKLNKTAWPWLESGLVRPIVHKTFPLAQAPEAHRLLESSLHIGKVVLTVS